MRRLLPWIALLSLFSRDDPRVNAANQAYQAGHYDEALRGYEDALRDRPNSPELAYDRGNALFKLGRKAEAREAYLSALGAPDEHLKAQDYYNMGNALWELERNDEAAQAYQRALLLDPSFEDARHNLELLLSPPPKPDAGQPDAGKGDGGGGDGGQKNNRPDGGMGDGGSPDGGQRPKGEDGGSSHNQPRDGGSQSPPSQSPKGMDAGPPPRLDKLQAAQLLDALRQREKNLQLWKFRPKAQPKENVEKDW